MLIKQLLECIFCKFSYKVFGFSFLELAFSTKSKILETVDCPYSLVTLILRSPFVLIQPLIASSPIFTSLGLDSPVRAEVSSVAEPSIIIPSSGIFSPVFTIMVSPIFTS